MLVVAADVSQGCAILVLGSPCDDAQWRSYIRAIDDLQARIDDATRPVLIQVLLAQLAMPSAVVRRELAQLRQRVRADAVNAVIAQDTSIRLVQTALDWLHKPHYASSSHADFASALAHVEAVLRRPVPALPRLYQEVRVRCNRPL